MRTSPFAMTPTRIEQPLQHQAASLPPQWTHAAPPLLLELCTPHHSHSGISHSIYHLLLYSSSFLCSFRSSSSSSSSSSPFSVSSLPWSPPPLPPMTPTLLPSSSSFASHNSHYCPQPSFSLSLSLSFFYSLSLSLSLCLSVFSFLSPVVVVVVYESSLLVLLVFVDTSLPFTSPLKESNPQGMKLSKLGLR